MSKVTTSFHLDTIAFSQFPVNTGQLKDSCAANTIVLLNEKQMFPVNSF